MKLQPASKKEVKRMAIGCSLCCCMELAGLLVLSLLGVGHFGIGMVIGAAGGTLVAISNFAMMCLMIQNAAGITDQKLMKAKVQGSYNLRLFIQAAWVVVAFVIPWINIISAAIPLLFPTAVIYTLQMSGKLLPNDPNPNKKRDTIPEEEPSEDNLNSFEV